MKINPQSEVSPDFPVEQFDFTRTMYLIRGLPHSGQEFVGIRLAAETYSLDSFIDKENFTSAAMKGAHEALFNAVLDTVKGGPDDVAVCATFSQPWEMERYVDLADANGMRVCVITAENDYRSDYKQVVPLASIQRTARRWVKLFTHRWQRLPKPEPRRQREPRAQPAPAQS